MALLKDLAGRRGGKLTGHPLFSAGADENVLQRAAAHVAGIFERRTVIAVMGTEAVHGASHPVGSTTFVERG